MYSVYQTKNISLKQKQRIKSTLSLNSIVSDKEKIDLAKNEFRLWTE